MNALSVQQPWPWLMLRPDLTNPLARRAAAERREFKDVENRTWSTRFVGPLLVHAGQKIDEAAYAWVADRFPRIKLPRPEELERGGIVGRVIVARCVTSFDSPWFVGPFGFVLESPDPLPLHKCRGHLGFFDVPGFTRPK